MISFIIKNLCIDIDECATGPCQNGGSCTDQINDYTCACVDGYDGLNCENGNIAISFRICYRYQNIRFYILA